MPQPKEPIDMRDYEAYLALTTTPQVNYVAKRLTAQEICAAALREFKTLPWTGSREGDHRRQMLVTFQVDPNEFLLTIEEFAEKKIRPAMQELASQVPSDVIFLYNLELPKNINMAASSEYMRFVADTSWGTGQTMMRFDVVFELA